ncbi:MAG: GNAT family N-acetyltransferase [Verrucomicrobiota bacterium]
MSVQVEYLADAAVDAALDRQLRVLFTTCFTNPQDHVFRQRRYFKLPYPHRWTGRDPNGEIVAHIGAHERTMEIDGIEHRVGGVAEVCVHPNCRGRGYAWLMLSSVHEWLAENGFSFALLFGDPAVYRSSGYVPVDNLFGASADPGEGSSEHLSFAHAKALTKTPWPTTDVFMEGVPF